MQDHLAVQYAREGRRSPFVHQASFTSQLACENQQLYEASTPTF